MSDAAFDLAEARRRLASPDEEERRRAIAEIPEGWTAGVLTLLADALGDGSWRVRKDAVARLARWPDPAGAIPTLIALLAEDDNVGLRNSAIEALSAIGAPAVGPLCTALEAGGDYRKFVIEALAAIGDRRAVGPLVKALEDEDENVRASAAEALGALGGPDAIAALRRRLRSSDLLGRLAALEALNRLGAPAPIADVTPLVGQPILRRAALEALGHAGDPAGLSYLLDGLSDKIRGAREASAVALVALHARQTTDEARGEIERAVAAAPEHALSGLVAAVSADAVAARRAAVTILGWARAASALPRLVDALRDEEIHAETTRAIATFGEAAVAPLVELAREAGGELRTEVYALLPRLGAGASDPRVQALLTRALEDQEEDAAAAAARALGDAGGREALAPLFHALDRQDAPMLRQAASSALARLARRFHDEVRILVYARGIDRGPSAPLLCRILGAAGRAEDRPALLLALKADEAAIRRAAAEAIAQIPAAPEAREALVFALADEDPRVRAAAAEALGRLGDRAATAALAGAAGDEDEAVRIAAARALGSLGDPEGARALRALVGDRDGVVVVHALEALARLERPEDEAVFLEAMERRDPEVVKAAAQALAARATPRATEGLTRALSHARWDVRRLAADALGRRVPDPAALAALRARAGMEDDPLVREAIEAALGRS